MDNKLIGKMICFHRQKAKLSQAELAALSGIGKTAVFDIENGKLSIRLTTLLRILNILNIKIQFTGPLMPLFEKELNEES